MARIAKAVAVVFVLLGTLLEGHGHLRLCSGFLPENTLRIPVGDLRALGIDKARFDRVLDRVERVYGPEFAARGTRLVVDRLWDDPTVNAYATQAADGWHIAMFGGLARHAAVTEDGFAIVACHELGHHIGGFPKYEGGHWATNEGGSDYFSTLKCLRRLQTTEPRRVDPTADRLCQGSFSNRGDRSKCMAAAMAAASLTKIFIDLGDRAPALNTPDPAVVDATDDNHPAGQCRLDTYFAGAVCPKAVSEAVSESDPVAGSCTRKNGYMVGLRPRCWYKPPADEPAAPSAPRLSLLDAEGLEKRLESLRSALGGA